MGQRHQLFVIARVGHYYRSLAAVHHQWLYGMGAVSTALRLMEIFSDKSNRTPLMLELALAKEYYKDDGPPEIVDSIGFRDKGPLPFPFIMTCLVVGASYNPDAGSLSIAHELDINVAYDEMGNNNGITVIDITVLTNIRYCFVDFNEMESARPVPLHTPLSSWDYLLAYYERNHRMVRHETMERIERFGLIDVSTLAARWPLGNWSVTNEVPAVQPRTGTPSLRDSAMAKLVGEALQDEDFDPSILDLPRQIPEFKEHLQRALADRREEVRNSRSAAGLLKVAFAGEKHIDLSPYRSLPGEILRDVLHDPEVSGTAEIVSISAATLSARALAEALPPSGIAELYLLDCPDAAGDYDEESERASGARMRDLLDTPQLLRRVTGRLVPFPLFRKGVRQQMWLPALGDPPARPQQYPVLQLLCRSRNPLGARGDAASTVLETLFLGDALLSPTRFVTGLYNLLRLRLRNSSNLGNGLDAALSFACGSPELGSVVVVGDGGDDDSSRVEIGALPAELYMMGRTSYQGGTAGDCWTRMRDLRPDSWTAVMTDVTTTRIGNPDAFGLYGTPPTSPSSRPPVERKRWFHIAMVRARRRRIPASAEAAAGLTGDDLEVLGLDGFLEAHGVGVGVEGGARAAVDALSARLDGFADSGVRGLCQEGRRVLSPMGAAEACEVLREMLLGRTSAEMELRKARVSRFPGGLPEEYFPDVE